MVDHGKRKKYHDKDKYYKLAKEQGFRSRAAFKLTQIHRKFPTLLPTKDDRDCCILDLCAAPGGWTQVLARATTLSAKIVAVDILPIRSLGNKVTTLIGDITTEKCKADIRRAVGSEEISLVVHDGAPNVGGSYEKDAYAQNELTLHALKCATTHLKRNGSFITKVYRSRDYASLVWVLQQLFKKVHAFKPKASRSQSAETYLVAMEYLKPDKLDAKFLDPKHVFEHVAGDTTGGAATAASSSNFHIFHKAWDKQRRQRDGYDMEHYDATMRHDKPVAEFVDQQTGMKDAIHLLSVSTGMTFHCEKCRTRGHDSKEPAVAAPGCHCDFLKHHPITTPEIKMCLQDLKVLNKSDFKGLLTWRTKMQQALQDHIDELKQEDGDDDDKQQREESAQDNDKKGEDDDDDEDEAQIQAEITAMRERRLKEKKRLKKKERLQAAKRRKRAALGMDLNAIDVPEHDQIFSLATITTQRQLDQAAEVDLDKMNNYHQVFGDSDDDDDDDDSDIEIDKDDSSDNDDDENDNVEKELDAAYEQYLLNTKNAEAKAGTKMAKRSKKLIREKALQDAMQDQEVQTTLDYETKTYAKLLQGSKDDDDDDDDSGEDDDDDGFHAKPMTPGEHAAAAAKKKVAVFQPKPQNPLIHQFPDEPSAKTARWFSNPLFADIGKTVESSMIQNNHDQQQQEEADYNEDDNQGNLPHPKGDTDNDMKPSRKKKANDDDGNHKKAGPSRKRKAKDDDEESKNVNKKITADDVLASIPKTDKQIRHERRLKNMAREERKKQKRMVKSGELDGDFEVVANANQDNDDDEDTQLQNMTDAQREKVLQARKLIKAGMGMGNGTGATVTKEEEGFQVVRQEQDDDRPLPVIDTRQYDSDHEDYDSDDYAKTLALGTMMLRRSKAKALVDASYNRYAWNDPNDLPEWFVDDEAKFYKPQLPIPPALVAKMKEKMEALSVKPIKKVAEARARKNKRARAKVAAAKKQAQAVANSSDLSEAMKLKAISKALRGAQGASSKKPGKKYVVAKKGRGIRGAKGVKFVDKRMKNDKRSMDRAEKKHNKGKQNGLTGSKKRRHHR